MDLQHIEHFVALAEGLHFGQVAARLGTTQPQLTRSIQRLERALRVTLVNRTTRKLQLTPAGVAYLPEARKLVEHASLARLVAQRAQAVGLTRVRIGYIAPALPILTSALRTFRKEFPELEIALEQRSSEAQMQGLRDGSLDIAVFSAIQGTSGLRVRTVRRYRFVALVPSDWPIAQKKRLQLADLADLPFIVAPHDRAPIVQSAILLACHGAGFAPRIAQTAIQAYTIEGLVSAGVGVALQPEIYRGLPLDGVAYKAITDLPDYMHWDLVAGVVDSVAISKVVDLLMDRIVSAGERSPAHHGTQDEAAAG